MTAFVLDASVTAAWLLPDAASTHTQRLYARIRRDEVDPQAPNLWQWECGNRAPVMCRSGGQCRAVFRPKLEPAFGRCLQRAQSARRVQMQAARRCR